MKRVFLLSIFSAAAMFAQSGVQPQSAPVTPQNSKATTTTTAPVKKSHKVKKATTAKPAASSKAAKSSKSKVPAKTGTVAPAAAAK